MKRDADPLPLLDDEDPLKNARPGKPARHGRRRWPKVLLGILVALLLLAGFLPRIASLAPVRALVLSKVNARLAPSTLAVDDWSLRWFGGMSVSGIHLVDAARGADLQVVKITTSGGLAHMLPFGRLDLGTITVDAIFFAVSNVPRRRDPLCEKQMAVVPISASRVWLPASSPSPPSRSLPAASLLRLA